MAKVLYCCYGDFTSSMKYGVSDNFLTNWRLLYQKEPWTVYKSSKGVDYGSRFCLNYGDGMVGLYSVVSRDHSTMSVTDIKMVLVAPGYLLSWRYDSDGTCHDVKFKYNGWQMDCEDAIRRCANDKKATGEAHSSQTNANSMTRKVIWTAEASNHPATPYSLDSDIQRLSAKVQKGTPIGKALTRLGGVAHEIIQLISGEAHTLEGSLADIKSNERGINAAGNGKDCNDACGCENEHNNPL